LRVQIPLPTFSLFGTRRTEKGSTKHEILNSIPQILKSLI
jgi:hypothetical protein